MTITVYRNGTQILQALNRYQTGNGFGAFGPWTSGSPFPARPGLARGVLARPFRSLGALSQTHVQGAIEAVQRCFDHFYF